MDNRRLGVADMKAINKDFQRRHSQIYERQKLILEERHVLELDTLTTIVSKLTEH